MCKRLIFLEHFILSILTLFPINRKQETGNYQTANRAYIQYATKEKPYITWAFLALFWQRFCEKPAKLSTPMSIRSQITVNCPQKIEQGNIGFIKKYLFLTNHNITYLAHFFIIIYNMIWSKTNTSYKTLKYSVKIASDCISSILKMVNLIQPILIYAFSTNSKASQFTL